MEIPASVNHLATQKEFRTIQHFTHRQLAIGVLICQLNQVVSLQLRMILIVRINVNLPQKCTTNMANILGKILVFKSRLAAALQMQNVIWKVLLTKRNK